MTEVHVLVIGGGGMLGLAELAALCALDRWGLIKLGQFDTVIGTSIGALIALCVVCGLDAGKLRQVAFDRKLWHDMIGANDLHMLDLLTFDRDALCDERPLKRTLELLVTRHLGHIFSEATVHGRMTFERLHARTGGRRLIVNATDADTGKIVLFDHQRTPNVSVLEAIRASMSVPLLFPSVTLALDSDSLLTLKDGGTVCNVCGHLYPLENSLVICMGEQSNPLSDNPLGLLWTLTQRLNELERSSWWPADLDNGQHHHHPSVLVIGPKVPTMTTTTSEEEKEIELCRRLWSRRAKDLSLTTFTVDGRVTGAKEPMSSVDHLLAMFSYDETRARRLWLHGMLSALTFWKTCSSNDGVAPSNWPRIGCVPC